MKVRPPLGGSFAPVFNRKNPKRNLDPTRTLAMRQAFVAELRRRFRLLKGKVWQLVVDEDAFGLKEREPLTFGEVAQNAVMSRVGALCGPAKLVEVEDVRQPNDYLCGAAAAHCVAMLRGVAPATLEETAEELGTTVERSTHPSAIVDYFVRRGVLVEQGHNLAVDDLRRYHELGWPVIVPVQDYMGRRDPKAEFDYGHYLTVIGVGFGYVFCQDSSLENWEKVGKGVGIGGEPGKNEGNIDMPGHVMVPEAEFLKVWHDVDADGKQYVRYGIAVGPQEALNAFCPTGPGGGVDASCAPGGSASSGGDHHSKIAALVRSIPAKAYSKIKTQVKGKYDKLEHRYGGKWAKAIIAAGLAGLPIPAPGASFASAAVVIGLAELSRQAGFIKNEADETSMTDAEVQAAAEEFIEELRLAFKEMTANADFTFATDPEKLKQFKAWLRRQYRGLGLTQQELWQKFAEDGFKQGAGRAFDDVNGPYYAAKMGEEGFPDFMKGGKEQFLRSAFGRPETVEKIQLLAERSYTDLVNVTEDMATKMGRELASGLARGANPRDIADELDDVLDLGLARADVIARTEIIRAHAEGQLDAFEKLGVTELGVEVEWSTARDERVCPECEDMEGKIFAVEDAHDMIPLHPQCRCAFIPYLGEGADK